MKPMWIFLCLILSGSFVNAQQKDLLSSKFTTSQLQQVLVPLNGWRPFPAIGDRDGWARAHAGLMKAYVTEAEAYLGWEWPHIPATKSLLIARTGDRDEYQRVSFQKRVVLGTLILAEIAENRGRFVDQIVNGIWSICEESFWGVPAHLPQTEEYSGLMDVSRPFVDLFAAETATYLAWADYFIGEKLDAISPQIRKRIYFETNNRIFQPLLTTPHWWMNSSGTGARPNNWNPWICSNWLNAVLLLEKDPQKRAEGVTRVLEVLDNFLDPYPDDGGCDEGPSYWGAAAASLFDNVSMLNAATNDAFRYVYEDPKVKNMGQYIYRAQISQKYYINFADADPQPGIPAGMTYRYGKAIGDNDMMQFGAFYRKPSSGKIPNFHYFRNLFQLFIEHEFLNAPQKLPLPKEFWWPDLQVLAARDNAGSTKGFFLAVKGGHNNESHNHNDIGNYVVYYDGQPLLIDVGRGTYTRKTFSPKRYQIWYNCSDYHNLPSINGRTQSPGPEYKATHVAYKPGRSSVQLTLNIEKAYPEDTGVTSFQRVVRLDRMKGVSVEDVMEFAKATGDVIQYLMTVYPPEVMAGGKIRIPFKTPEGEGRDFYVTYDEKLFSASVEKVSLSEPEDKGVVTKWGDNIYRISLVGNAVKSNSRMVFRIN